MSHVIAIMIAIVTLVFSLKRIFMQIHSSLPPRCNMPRRVPITLRGILVSIINLDALLAIKSLQLNSPES